MKIDIADPTPAMASCVVAVATEHGPMVVPFYFTADFDDDALDAFIGRAMRQAVIDAAARQGLPISSLSPSDKATAEVLRTIFGAGRVSQDEVMERTNGHRCTAVSSTGTFCPHKAEDIALGRGACQPHVDLARKLYSDTVLAASARVR